MLAFMKKKFSQLSLQVEIHQIDFNVSISNYLLIKDAMRKDIGKGVKATRSGSFTTNLFHVKDQFSKGFIQSSAGFLLYILGLTGFIGSTKVLAPLVFNFRRYTLSPQDTYKMLNSGPPKQTLEVCPLDGGTGSMAFTRPS